jgi:hypothetical protein
MLPSRHKLSPNRQLLPPLHTTNSPLTSISERPHLYHKDERTLPSEQYIFSVFPVIIIIIIIIIIAAMNAVPFAALPNVLFP